MTREVFTTPEELADAVARRLLGTIASHQQTRPGRPFQLSLTGGTIASEVYRRLPQMAGHSSDGAAAGTDVDWSGVELWWSDERWVPADSSDRNAEPVLDLMAALPFGAVHPMPDAAPGVDLRAAAAAHAAELGDTVWDLCLLGMGPDGHVASLFPGHRSAREGITNAGPQRVIAVDDSPKPPPQRLSVTMPVINASTEIWLLVSGAEKAEALAGAIAGDPHLPASQVAGREATRWFCDRAAAGQNQ